MELAAEMAESIVHNVDLLMLTLQDQSAGKRIQREVAALKDAIESFRTKFVDCPVSTTASLQDATSLDRVRKVKAALYDIEHFVDIIYAARGRTCGASTSLLGHPVHRIVDSFFNYRWSASKIRDMKGTFGNPVDNNVSLPTTSILELRRDNEETHSLLSAESVVGRTSERNAINRLLVSDLFSAVLIYGMEGLGKTSVAQLVGVPSPGFFDHCFWVWVGNELNSTSVISKVSKAISAQIQALALGTSPTLTEQISAGQSGTATTALTEQTPEGQSDITHEDPIREKKLLLILDDIRTLNEDTLARIRDSSMFAASSTIKVVITTRSKQLATASYGKISTTFYELRALSDDDAWTLFKKVAFFNHKDLELLDLSWDITKRTNNMPRTITDLASLVNSEDKGKWKALMNADFSCLREAYTRFTSSSDLAFRLLPSPLKRCFAYSAYLIQQNDSIEMHQLIHLWIAQGYIEQPALDDENQTLEEVSEGYYEALKDWSFFKNPKADFDLAKSIAANEMLAINFNCTENGSVLCIERCDYNGVYHLFISNNSSQANACPGTSDSTSSSLLKKWITSLPPQLRSFLKAPGSTIRFTGQICDQLFLSMSHLRALDLNSSNIIVVPASIALLKHLRYLNLSLNDFTKLPDSITTLAELQVVDLSFCKELVNLPRHFSRLSSLRHLYLNGCEKLTGMPVGLGKMTALQTLNVFVLGNTEKSCTLDELSSLNLKSELTYRFASQYASSSQELDSKTKHSE